ncbi:hypothetical protein [Metasolibacillus sp.]|uniref:hypothetical protein n=1 Tax=Metasolibacillus sp. TaxID=2703680 RepID=UPI0025D6A03A|nr:hypothetical protein [Metasolibacillus sp.]MCT6925291.1 hypothetical protein [Metasolibacillus sp.]MCT6941479.1 hypothetical protein [Metasolibacillus sp.]
MAIVSTKSLRRLSDKLPSSAGVAAGALLESADYIDELEALISTMTNKIESIQDELNLSRVKQMDLIVDKADYIKGIHLINEHNKQLREALEFYQEVQDYKSLADIHITRAHLTKLGQDMGATAREALLSTWSEVN